MKTAIIFPGQGVQAVGMARDFVENFDEAREVFEIANQTLNRDLLKLVMEGTIDDLNITRNTQPAIISAEIAMLRVFMKNKIAGDVTAGLSLGEYSALIYSGALKLEDALPLVEKRGELMLQGQKGKMAAVIGADRDKVIDICRRISITGDFVVPANFNSMQQIVISGDVKGVDKAITVLEELGARVVPLPLSSPFHTKLLKSASVGLGELLKDVEIKKPEIPVYFNAIADIEDNPETIKELLTKQVMKPVLWVDTMIKMLDSGVDTFIEIGPGKTLSGFLKRMPYEYKVYNVNDLATLEKTLTSLGG